MTLERITIAEADQHRLLLETAAAAGQILTERKVDCRMDVAIASNRLADQRQSVLVSGPGSAPGTEHEFWFHTTPNQEVSCSRKTTNDDGVDLYVTERRLRDREGGIRIVMADFLNGFPQPEKDSPANLEAVGEMLENVHWKTTALAQPPEFRVRALPYRDGRLAVPAAALTPLVGRLIGTVGKALLTIPDGRTVDTQFKVDVNSTGKVHGNRYGRQIIKLSVVDNETGEEGHFTLQYSFGIRTPREEYAFVESYFQSINRNRRPAVSITEGLQQEGGRLVVVRSHKVGEKTEGETTSLAPNDSIVRMAGKVLELLA